MKFKFFRHLGTILRHKYEVFKLCCRCGLFYRGLVHDLSKFHPLEFFEGVKYYRGIGSPISKCRKINGYSKAWLHHKGRNKHHIEYWYDLENVIQMNMPYKYAVECICDKIAASKCYNKKEYTPEKVLNHWEMFGQLVPTNDNMKEFFYTVFKDLVNNGEKYILNKKYLKEKYDTIVLRGDSK